MKTIERLKPDPIPAIHPMPEYLATGQRAIWYEETKQVLQVPWMGVVTMAYSHYPTFFGELWQGLKPLVRQPALCRGFPGFAKIRRRARRSASPRPPGQRVNRDGLCAAGDRRHSSSEHSVFARQPALRTDCRHRQAPAGNR